MKENFRLGVVLKNGVGKSFLMDEVSKAVNICITTLTELYQILSFGCNIVSRSSRILVAVRLSSIIDMQQDN